MNRTTFQNAAQNADLSIVEGMMDLFDGSPLINEIGSRAKIAKQLHVLVLLVMVDVVSGDAVMSRSHMTLGYRELRLT